MRSKKPNVRPAIKNAPFRSSKSRRDFLKDASALSAGLMIPTWAHGIGTMESANKGQYDFIIVGSGAGGGPLAARLARRGFHVLILEAGKDHQDPKVTVPAYHPLSTEDDRWSWNYFVKHSGQGSPFSDENDTKFVKDQGGILYPRASALGGCTVHNAMITMIPDDDDWRHMEKVTGDRSWRPRGMNPYFQKLENRRYHKVTGNRHYDEATYLKHAESPWLSTERAPLKHVFPGGGESKFLNTVLSTIKSQTGTIPGDTNYYSNERFRHRPEGIYRLTQSTRAGRRSSPRDWLIETQREYSNLKINTGYFATSLTFEDGMEGQPVVKGVKGLYHPEGQSLYGASPKYDLSLVREATPFEFRAKYEVILAGGAFNTPQLLMLSGIGDAQELDRVGVPTRVNLPGVGKNLQDRYEMGVVAQFKSEIDAISRCSFTPEDGDPCLEAYNRDNEGHLYGTNGVLIGNISKSDTAKKERGAADLIVFATPGKFKGYYPGWAKAATAGANNLTWAILKGKTKNTKGYVTLKSKNPHQVPEINFMNFQEGRESDLKAMMEGVQIARSINNREPLKSKIEDEVWPPKSKTTGKAMAGKELEQFIVNEAWGHHASCTSKMGPRPDDGDVVDKDFQVHKVKGLRIVDASIFPKIPGLFISVPIYMVAEKAADVITKKYQKV